MDAKKHKVVVKPTPILLQAVSKVEQVVARLQELQSTIHGSQLTSQSRYNSPKKSAGMECRVSQEFQSLLKLGRKKGSNSTPERRKSLTLADSWRHWSTPAKDIHDVISEIVLANQFNKRFINLKGGTSDTVHPSKPANKLLLDVKTDNDSSSQTDLGRASVNSSMSSGVLEPIVCSSVESLVSTPRNRRQIPLNRRSSSKKCSLKKPPPHLFKVVIGNEGPAAKTGPAVNHQQVEPRKIDARKITTPSPMYKRKSGTLVQRPLRVSGELRSSLSSLNSSIRGSIERKRLTDSASLRRSTEKFVEACRAMMEEEEQLKRANGQDTGKAVHFSNSPPIVIRPLKFESPNLVKVKPAGKSHKNWLTHRFSKSSSTKESSMIKPKNIFKSSSRDLPTLISRLPAQKVETATVPLPSEPAKVMKETFPERPSLPLPPARQADNVLKNSARGMAMKASKDKKSGYTSYALEPTVLLTSSRESLAEVDSNLLKENDKKRCSVGCPPKDLNSSSYVRKNENNAIRTSTDVNLPNYMKARAGSKPGKENSSKSINTAAKHSSGTSLLHRAKDWVTHHKTKDKGTKRVPESSQGVAVAL